MAKGFEELRLLNVSGADVSVFEYVGLDRHGKKVIPKADLASSPVGDGKARRTRGGKGKEVKTIQVSNLSVAGVPMTTAWDLTDAKHVKAVNVVVRLKKGSVTDFEAEAHVLNVEGGLSVETKDIK